MGKLIIKFQGKLIGEVSLKLGETTVGRKPVCDIVLDDVAVSGQHALVKTVGVKSTIQDLGSKNGTFVEGERVTQHPLRHGDTINIGGHALIYRDDPNLDAPVLGKRPGVSAAPTGGHKVTTELMDFAQFVAVEGKNKGKRLPLIKDLVELDNPGKSPARISRTAHGYLLEVAAVGPGEPTLNGKPVRPGGELLKNGDIVDVAGTKLQFSK